MRRWMRWGLLLGAGALAAHKEELALHARIEAPPDPEDADYQGQDWSLEWNAQNGHEDLPTLAWLFNSAIGLQAQPAPADEGGVRVLAAAPHVGGYLNSGGVRRLDLGEDETAPAARFSLEADPPAAGRVEVWLRGGACAAPDDCFSGLLERVASANLSDGPLVWRPAKGDRGVYRAVLWVRDAQGAADLAWVSVRVD